MMQCQEQILLLSQANLKQIFTDEMSTCKKHIDRSDRLLDIHVTFKKQIIYT